MKSNFNYNLLYVKWKLKDCIFIDESTLLYG
jgi:hypothetical protein